MASEEQKTETAAKPANQWAHDITYLYFSRAAATIHGCDVYTVEGPYSRQIVLATRASTESPERTLYNWADTQITWCGNADRMTYKGEYSAVFNNKTKYRDHPPEIHVDAYVRKGRLVHAYDRHAAHARDKGLMRLRAESQRERALLKNNAC
jgi:hypothetical protein